MDSSKMEVDLFSWLTEDNGVDFIQGAKDSPSLDLAWCTPPPNQDIKYDLPAWMESREDVEIEKYNLFEDELLKEDLDDHGGWINSDPPVAPLPDTGGIPPVCTALKDAMKDEEISIKDEDPTSCLSNVISASPTAFTLPASTLPASTLPASTLPASTLPVSTLPGSADLPSSAIVTSPLATICPTSESVPVSGTRTVNKTSTSTPRVIIKVLKVNVPYKSKGMHVVPCGSISRVQTDKKPEDKNTHVHPTILPQSNCLLTPPQSPGKDSSAQPNEEFFMDSDADQLLDELVNMVGPENAEFGLNSSIHSLDDMDELLSHLDSESSDTEPPSPLSSQSHSFPSFSPASSDMSVPSPASCSKAGSSSGKTKSARTRRSEPYIADLKQRKKEQNKRAALRYRQKKKQEEDSVSLLLKEEEERQQELKNKYKDLKQELGYLKKLMRDVFVAKGVISAEGLK